MSNNTLFADFPTTTKAQWLARIEKDLRGRSLSDLDWHLPHLDISPFAHIDDFEGQSFEPLQNTSQKNTWEFCAKIQVNNHNVKLANKQALGNLMSGANALLFCFDDFPSAENLQILLNNIELEYISTYFQEQTANKNPLSFLKNFQDIVKSQGKDPKILRGGIHFDPFADGRHEAKVTANLVKWAHENMPFFTVVTIDSSLFFKDSENVVEELTQTLQSANNYLSKLIEKGVDINILKNHISFNCPVGISYFVEIAKIRALKLLWGNLLASYDTPSVLPTIHSVVTAETYVDDNNTNKIRATTQAMSAIIGGAKSLTIENGKNIRENENAFHQRITLNINNLLQMESYLDKVQDPSAGSYYVENLTTQIAEKVWAGL